MKKLFTLLFSMAILVILFSQIANAQLTGTKNIPGDYATLAAAITDLNTQGVGSGGVTLNLIASNPQTAPAGGYVIGGTGSLVLTTTSSSNQVIIQGNSNTITAPNPQTSGNLNDAIFKLIGADWITITGFTMQENASNTTITPASNNMTEWGVALLYVSATDGAKSNTIQGNTINLNKTYTNTWGVYSNTRHTATAVTATADITNATGSNSNNKVYGNTISNVNMGIAFIGSGTAAYQDTGNDIGGASAGTGNAISNWGGLAAASSYVSNSGTSYCIFMNHQTGDNISYNTLTSVSVGGTPVTFRGIFKAYTAIAPTGTFTSNITNNTVTMTSGFTSGTFEAIKSQDMTVLSTATININYNNIIGCAVTGASSSSTIVGIANSSAPGVLSISNNIIRSNTSTATTGGFTGIQNSGAVVTTINLNNNQIGNATGGAITFSAATSEALYGINNTLTGGASTCALSIQTNDIRGIVYSVASSGTNNYIYNGAATLSQNISSNTYTNLNVNTTGTVYFIYNAVPILATGTQTVGNNSIVTAYNKGGAGGSVYLFYSNASSVVGAVVSQQNNNFSNITVTGATTVAGWQNTDGGAPTKTVTGNVFNNWTCGTNAITGLNVNYLGGISSVSNNTITNITGQGAITGLLIGLSGAATSVTINSNTITNLTSSGTGGVVTGLSSGSPATVVNIYGNTINTLTTTGTTVYGISSSGTTSNIYQNIINTLSSTNVAGTVHGIYFGGGTTVNAYRNKVYDLFGNQAGTIINGIYISLGTTFNVYNNLIGDLRATAATSTNAINGIYASASSTYNVYFNSIYLNATSSSVTNFGTSCITFNKNATVFNMINNILVNLSTPAQEGSNVATNGISACLRRTGGTTSVVPANYAITSNNNDFWCNPTAGTNNHLTYVEGTSPITNPYNTVAGFKSFLVNMDQASFAENPTFVSTTGSDLTYLHINTSTPTYIESGGQPITGITDDYDGNTRNTSTPDVGADEFNGINPNSAGSNSPQTGNNLYYFANSTSGASGAPSQPTFSWIDPSGGTDLIVNSVGTPTSGTLDNGYFTVSTGLPTGSFELFGTNYTTVYIGTNGYVSFGAGYTDNTPSAIPSSGTTPNNAIYGLWADLKYDNASVTGNKLTYRVVGSDLVITYLNAPTLATGSTNYVSFQIILTYSASPVINSNFKIQFDDAQAGDGWKNTTNGQYYTNSLPHLVGVEGDGTAGTALQYRFVSGGSVITAGPLISSPVAIAMGPNNGVLPVMLSSFTSSINGHDVKLSWTTASENNNSGFEILRSAQNDNGSWTKIGYVTGSGTKTTPTNYTFDDKKLNTGKYKYRLKQIDKNGNFEYYNLSAVVEVGVPTKYDISQNYPNPFNPTTKIDFDLPFDSKVSLKLYDMSGRELLTIVNEQRPAGYYTAQMNAGNLSSGAYFYRIIAEGNGQKYISTKKAILIK